MLGDKLQWLLVANKLLNGQICESDILERITFYVPDDFTRATELASTGFLFSQQAGPTSNDHAFVEK